MALTADRTWTITLPPTPPSAAPAPAEPTGRRPLLQVLGPMSPRYADVLTPEALEFLSALHTRFAGARHELLVRRQERRAGITEGADPCFLPETAAVRADPTWQVAGAGPGLEDRRVQIAGPTDPRTAVDALGSGASVWLADLEDATSPTWENVMGGQLVLRDAVRGRLSCTDADGREHHADPRSGRTPTIVVRPRGWQLTEKHLCYVDRAGHRSPASASLVDVGLHLFHNARELIACGAGPYFSLPKLEGHLEARLWNEVFVAAQQELGLPRGTIRATVLIETVTAAFEMEEILHELREHCAGLDAGRWDYLFSLVKGFRDRGPEFVLPDREAICTTAPPLRTFAELLVETCHRRGAHALGGMSAVAPQPQDPAATARALAEVAADERREAAAGFDGTWVAHPALVAVARAQFDAVLGERPHQVVRPASGRREEAATAAQLLDVGALGGRVTDAGLRRATATAVRYLDAWLRGRGALLLDGLVEDAATAEISRSLVWQWVRHEVTTAEGARVTREHAEAVLAQVLAELPRTPGDRVDEAAEVFREVALGEEFPTFLTVAAYGRHLVQQREPLA
ncbi:malate synthase A [Quadrisphaera sp. DSM 44207]|uniref:malate synthase A n=1 Tax=Quadrisphaera sp. DSM 44207 TaxID=1881057 RepID=UPI0008871E21|nr:malate synthase A [Quadrisphaera sp. DSM 44207]SDQ18985.1 malate synthase [Quadrisphaera sp. DSM 44207]